MSEKLTLREIDGLIAEKVMGWKPSGIARDFNGVPFPEECPRYSTDIAAAWEVVKHLNADRRYGLELEMDHAGQLAASFIAPVAKWMGTGEAPTAPLAICLAALKAHGIDAIAAAMGRKG